MPQLPDHHERKSQIGSSDTPDSQHLTPASLEYHDARVTSGRSASPVFPRDGAAHVGHAHVSTAAV
jgi:hypothetical protein